MSSGSSAREGASGGLAKIVAILSAASGTGCTSTVANLAFVLAGAGRRVLVIDWGSDLPRVREYLEPFYVGQASLPVDVARSLLVVHTARPVHDDDPLPTAARFVLPEAAGVIDVIAPADDDGTTCSFPNIRHGGLEVIVDLQKQLPRAGYDELLIDAPTGSVDASLKLIATLCDLAIVCFRPRPRAIRDAAEMATRLRREALIGIGVVPVATVFDDRYQPRVDRIRHAIQAAFIDVLAHQEPQPFEGGAVEIPYRPHDTFDPVLTVLVEEPSPDNRLHAGYGRLAAAITGGVVTAPVSVSPLFRARYQRVFGLDSVVEPDRILVAYATPDRPWADWVRGRLERSGAQTETLRRGQAWLEAQRPLGLVIIASEHLDESAELAAVTDTLADAEAGGRPLNVFRVLVGRQTAPVANGASVAVTPGSEQELVARLLNHFGLIDRPSTEPVKGLRLPGDRPEVFSVPPRHPCFVGRDDDIEKLRDQLVESTDGRTTVTLGGVPGVGKSELALEYAYRFAGDYDLVWWVPAGDEQSAMVSLARLAARLEEPGSSNYGTTAALDRLATDPAHRRFLLIYDNIGDRAGLDDLLPSEHRGHVIITSSEARLAEIELAAMTPRDSALLLTSQVPGLSPEDAVRAAAAAGQLPMVLELAGTWLAETAAGDRRAGGSVADSATWAVSAFCATLAESDAESSWQDMVSRVVVVVADSLRTTPVGRVTLLLAQMCSFLSQGGISLDLVRSTPMFDQLIAAGGDDAGPLRLDAGEIDRVLWTGVRHGLFRVDWGRASSLRLHRVVQAALLGAMTPQDRAERRAGVLEALAAFAPTEVEELAPHYVARFAELQKHVFPSGATDSDDDTVRRWLVNQVHFLFMQGGPGVRRAAIGPTQKLLDDWTSRHGLTDSLRLRLASQLANLYRAVGDHPHALRLDDAALAEQRRLWELNHPQALFSALGRGGDLRGLGLFDEALEEDQATRDGFRETFGEDHPHTRMAAHNLASAMFLSGDVAGALTLAESNYRRRLRLLAENDVSTWAWGSLIQIGVYRRELGDYSGAWDALLEAAQRLRRLRPEPNPHGLIVRWHQAIVLRCQGEAKAAKKRNGEALRALRELLGPDHPNTLACKLSFAAAHRAVGGEPALGVELAEAVLDSYLHKVRLVEEHPFVALTRIGLGLALCAAGQDGSAETGRGWELLRGKLGDVHPWTLAAAVDHARVTAVSGDPKRAADLVEVAHVGCVEYLGAGHPHTAIATHNLRIAFDQGESANDAWREIDVDVPES